MRQEGLRPETEATLLLCGTSGAARGREQAAPLNVREFTSFLRLLERLSIPLGDLTLRESRQRLEDDIEGRAMLDGRIGTLLDRGAAMAIALERWQSQGIWVLDRTHPDYPERFRERLGDGAPPLLYGAGEIGLLQDQRRRIAVVGSRDIDAQAEAFAIEAGRQAAAADTIIVSGGARGVDRLAVEGVLDAGGTAINVLPGDLLGMATSRRYRDAIVDGRLVLTSPYHPQAKFSAGNAMGRNRLIYCLADAGVVVESAAGSGGTWTGALETIRHGWVPVFARTAGQPSAGIQDLLEHGALGFDARTVNDPLAFQRWLEEATNRQPEQSASSEHSSQLNLFDDRS